MLDSHKNRTRSATTKKKTYPASVDAQRRQICDIAARIVHEDGIRDYQKAKQRACDSLHLKANTFLPTNDEIEQAVQARIELFGSARDAQHSQPQFSVAFDTFEILGDFQPRLTGSLINGVTLKNTPIEIHCFSDIVELITEELNWRGINNHCIEKRFRYPNNQYVTVPLVIFQLDDHDIEVSVFREKELHRSPVCPTNGRKFKRLSQKELSILVQTDKQNL